MPYNVLNGTEFTTKEVTQCLTSRGHAVRNLKLRPLSEQEMCAALQGVDAVLASNEPYSERVFQAARGLKIVARAGAGYDAVDLKAATHHGVWVTNAPNATSNAVADYTMAMILCLIRSIPKMLNDMKAGVWKPILGTELGSLTLGIVGTGHIGRQVIQRARACGAQVLAFDIKPDEGFAAKHEVQYVGLDELLSRSDIVSLHCVLNEQTRGLVNEKTLNQMKQGAYLINTSRPGVIVKDDLVAALKSGRLGGAAIDVHDPKPCRPDDPLIAMDNVIATPWAAAATDTAWVLMGITAAEEVVRVLEGSAPQFPLNRPQAVAERGR